MYKKKLSFNMWWKVSFEMLQKKEHILSLIITELPKNSKGNIKLFKVIHFIICMDSMCTNLQPCMQ